MRQGLRPSPRGAGVTSWELGPWTQFPNGAPLAFFAGRFSDIAGRALGTRCRESPRPQSRDLHPPFPNTWVGGTLGR